LSIITWSFDLSIEKYGMRDIPYTRHINSSVLLINHLRDSHWLNDRALKIITRLIASGSQ